MKPQIPWLRVFVEGVVIVGSILLALSLESWLQDRQDRSRAVAHLGALSAEIKDVRATLLENVEQARDRISAIDSLVLLITDSNSRPTSDTIRGWIAAQWGTPTPAPALAALDDLRESGSVPMIETDELRRALFGYERYAEEMRGIEERSIRAWEEGLRPYLVAHTDVLQQVQSRGFLEGAVSEATPAFGTDLDALLRDRTFQNLLLARRGRLDRVVFFASTALTRLDEIATLIDAEIQAS